MPNTDDFANELRSLIEPMTALYAALRRAETRAAAELRRVNPAHAVSARNLVHYLALRTHDLRELQDRLAACGLSSLGRAEPCVAAAIGNVLQILSRVAGGSVPPPLDTVTMAEGRRLLEHNTCALLGAAHRPRRTRILVTLPSEAADPQLIRELLRRGMDLARINCAHDTPEQWAQMIDHLRRSSRELGKPCRVLMDIGGPKLRTGALAPGPAVIRIRPARDATGQVLAPACIWLTGADAAQPVEANAVLPVDPTWLSRLQVGDPIRLVDARQSTRTWVVSLVTEGGVLAQATKTTYVQSGTRLSAPCGDTQVQSLPPLEQPIVLRPGDRLLVTRPEELGTAGPPARIPCTLPQVFADIRRGDRIWFDDGTIGGRVAEVHPTHFAVEITDAAPNGSKLRADKGINLPDTCLRVPALDRKDEADLAFIAAHADLVGHSFVRKPSDVLAVHERLSALGRPDLGVLLKIETRDAFEHLPQLLLAAMRRPNVGVMIARGDLAVECGWERLAELQEEILWICEAAHVPVVWATQVLEHLTKEGRPSRAEITDAAMSERAECVMLNKGRYVADAVERLDDILRRMEGHQSKKRSMLRPLALAERFAARG